MVSLILSFAALGLASTGYGFPSGNSSAAPSARDHNLSSIDIRQAYLQSFLDPNVPLYMCPPPDVFPFDQHGSPLVTWCAGGCGDLTVWSQAGWSRVGRPLLLLPHHVGHDAIDNRPLSLCLDPGCRVHPLWVCVYVDEGLSSPTTTPSFAPALSPTYPLALPLPAPLPPPTASLKASWKEPPLTIA
jgi:hypothetical protein